MANCLKGVNTLAKHCIFVAVSSNGASSFGEQVKWIISFIDGLQSPVTRPGVRNNYYKLNPHIGLNLEVINKPEIIQFLLKPVWQ